MEWVAQGIANLILPLLAGVHLQPRQAMEKSGLVPKIGENGLHATMESALDFIRKEGDKSKFIPV